MAYDKKHLIDLGGLQMSIESVRTFIDKTVSKLPDGHKIVNITSNSDGTYTADVPISEIIESYGNGVLWFAVYDDLFIIPLDCVSDDYVCFANHEYEIIMNSYGTVEFVNLGNLYLQQRSDGTFYLTMDNKPISVGVAYKFDKIRFGGCVYRKAGQDGSSSWWIGLDMEDRRWKRILANYRASSISVSTLPGLPAGRVDSDGYVPVWNQTTQQYELKEIALPVLKTWTSADVEAST